MRRIATALALLLLAALPLRAEEGVERTITAQIEAFRADDVAGAFDHASPGIRRLFGTAERFGAMVRQGYPMVHRPSALRFLGIEARPGGLRQRVLIEDGAGRIHILAYDMVEIDGTWRIDGVQILDEGGAGA